MAADAQTGLLLGLIGAGIQASRAPAMHETEAAAHGIRCIYKLIDLTTLGLHVDALADLLTAAERLGFAGLNITHPCKQAVIPLLTELSSAARAIGAVNTVLLRDGRRIGHNTDWWGFAESFRRGFADAPRRNVVQLGAGGAGVAVAHALLTLGTGLLAIADIDSDRAEALARQLCSRFGADRAAACGDVPAALAMADGLVNATPVGMVGHPGMPLAVALLRPSLWVAEVIYFPLETELLRAARAKGCRTLDGGGMAVMQAAEAFRLFSGIAADPERMLRHFATLGAH
jgi:quinate/shikimate dehydrogenase (NAD+)